MPAIQLSFEQLEPRHLLSATGTGSISGMVFQDGSPVINANGGQARELVAQRDGRLTPDDTPIPRAVIELHGVVERATTDAGAKSRQTDSLSPMTAVTDERGFFEFQGLPAGTYSLVQRQPSGFADGIDTPGSAGGRSVEATEETFGSQKTQADNADRDAIVDIRLGAGERATQYNFSEIAISPAILPPCCTQTGAVHGGETPAESTPQTTSINQPRALPLETAVVAAAHQPEFIGGVAVPEWRWQLVVIDVSPARNQVAGNTSIPTFQQANAATSILRGLRFDSAQWFLADAYGQSWQPLFGHMDSMPVTGDFDGDGKCEIGVYVAGRWFIDLNGNGIWDAEDFWAELGSAADLPVVGDWDGDGKDDIGVFGPRVEAFTPAAGLSKASTVGTKRPGIRLVVGQPMADAMQFRNPLADGAQPASALGEFKPRQTAQFGSAQDIPVAGDWNGDGRSELGVYRRGIWHLDMNGDGRLSEADTVARFGSPHDAPIVGDWNGDGVDDIGVFRDGWYYLDSNANRAIDAADLIFAAGGANDRPVAGDWDGDGKDETGLFRAVETTRIARSDTSD